MGIKCQVWDYERTKLGFTPCGELSNSPLLLTPIKLTCKISKKGNKT